ncbi:MAG: hypothetical protein ACE5HS_23530 [bacterium]
MGHKTESDKKFLSAFDLVSEPGQAGTKKTPCRIKAERDAKVVNLFVLFFTSLAALGEIVENFVKKTKFFGIIE